MGTMYNDTMQTAYVGSLVTILILHDGLGHFFREEFSKFKWAFA